MHCYECQQNKRWYLEKIISRSLVPWTWTTALHSNRENAFGRGVHNSGNVSIRPMMQSQLTSCRLGGTCCRVSNLKYLTVFMNCKLSMSFRLAHGSFFCTRVKSKGRQYCWRNYAWKWMNWRQKPISNIQPKHWCWFSAHSFSYWGASYLEGNGAWDFGE